MVIWLIENPVTYADFEQIIVLYNSVIVYIQYTMIQDHTGLDLLQALHSESFTEF